MQVGANSFWISEDPHHGEYGEEHIQSDGDPEQTH